MKRLKAEILTIGNELLCGSVSNSNAAFLGRGLTQLGFEVTGQTACPDEIPAIHEALRTALRRSHVVVACGGLGPTPDDLTRAAMAQFFRVPLVFSKEQYRLIQRYYRERRREVPLVVRQEAGFPANAKPLLNQFGIALGFVIETHGRLLAVLPGVPGELTRLFEGCLKPLLARKFAGLRDHVTLTVKTIGLSEPSVMGRLGASLFKKGGFQFGSYPSGGEVTLKFSSDSSAVIRGIKKRVLQRMENDIYSFDDEPLEVVVGRWLAGRHLTLGVAESCTGGRVSELLTRVPGASRYFKGSVVAYHNLVKTEWLGVPKGILRRRGAVSREAALQTAKGVRRALDTSLGLAVTGIAGPTGGTRTKPVGRVYLAIASSKGSRVSEERFLGDREQIQHRAAKKALEVLWRWLKK